MQVGDEYDGDDFYCDVAIPHASELDVVHDDDRVLAFHHTKPFWQVHVVVVAKRHIASLTRADATDEPDIRALLTWTHGQLIERWLSGLARAELVRHGHAVFGPEPADV